MSKSEAASAAEHSATTDSARHGSGTHASEQLIARLQEVLVDLIQLGVQSKQAHWSVVGPNFRDTHLQLDEVVEAAREFADEVAERMRSLHGVPDGRTATVSAANTLPDYPTGEVLTSDCIDLTTAALDAVAATCRRVHDDVDEEDPTSADLLHAILQRLEQLSWMVSAENRTPAS